MKIYLAGGMGLMNVDGRERAVSSQHEIWRRLYSYHFKELITKSEIFTIKLETNETKSRKVLKDVDHSAGGN